MHWAAAYLGRPWQLGAAGPDAYDCWGLVRAVLLARRGIDVPAAGFDSEDVAVVMRLFAAHPERGRWSPVAEPAELDAVLMAQARQPVHVGLWLDVSLAGRILHATRAVGVAAHDRHGLAAMGYKIVGVYRRTPS